MKARTATLALLGVALAACQMGQQRRIANSPEGRSCVRECTAIYNQCIGSGQGVFPCVMQRNGCFDTCPEEPVLAAAPPMAPAPRVAPEVAQAPAQSWALTAALAKAQAKAQADVLDRLQACWDRCYQKQTLCDEHCHASSGDLGACQHKCTVEVDTATCKNDCETNAK